MTEVPEVAVVIGAYRRDRFLLSAVRSVLAQTLPRDRYEVIVTMDFVSPEVDRFLEEQRIPILLDNDPRIGTWLLRAVAATHAPYVAFLDDDDELEPERLSHALEVLRADPGLGFYRNRVRVIDERGEGVPPNAWRFYATDDYFDHRGPVTVRPPEKEGLAEFGLIRTRVSFNSSTMIVRRELLEGEFGATFARTQLPDLALFVLAAVSPFGLYLDDRRLTRYRAYPGKSTHRVPWLRHASEAYRDLASFAQAHGNVELTQRLTPVSEHYDRLYRAGTIVDQVGAGAARREVAHQAEEYLRFLGRHPAERAVSLDVWAAEMYAAAYLLVPEVARRMSARQSNRRSH
jgi:glycosyltransferase involved in cell wall biosynthesis